MRRLEDLPDSSLRLFERPPAAAPEDIRSVYLIGICGKGMGALAELLVGAGYDVSGSDEAAYPPMSTRLEALGVPIHEGYRAENVAAAAPDLVVVGNAAVPDHPEAAYARDAGLPQVSLPEALAHFFLSRRRSHVVAGTHGKTTTAGMLAHVLTHAGVDPGFFIGGVLASHDATCAVGSGAPFVIEGDEYDSAYFDKRPKFMHYRPHTAIVTSMEFDHADIYADWSDYRRAFRAFAGSLPSNGLLILNGDDAEVRALANYSWARIRFVGFEGGDDDITASNVRPADGGQTMEVWLRGERLGDLFVPMTGWGNRFNALAVTAAALDEGVPFETVAEGFRTFGGMERRQQVLGDADGVTVVDDFAHHPTAVRVTLDAVKQSYPSRRLIAVFEPRSNSSRRKVFELPYAEALTGADAAFISAPAVRHNDETGDFMDVDVVAATARELGVPTAAHGGADSLLGPLLQELRAGDVALLMSNGSFDDLPRRLLEELRIRERGMAAAGVADRVP
jgi:UDP-N-acetylmuramate: L-alanyl-gamma-D-glutamyl-meso-diaminopimelate ligase